MAELWAAGLVAAGSAYMSSRSAEKGQNKQIAADKETARIQAQEERQTIAYQAELGDFYGQQNKQRRADARAGTFDKYSQIAKPEGFERKPVMIARPDMPAPIIEEKPKKKGKK